MSLIKHTSSLIIKAYIRKCMTFLNISLNRQRIAWILISIVSTDLREINALSNVQRSPFPQLDDGWKYTSCSLVHSRSKSANFKLYWVPFIITFKNKLANFIPTNLPNLPQRQIRNVQAITISWSNELMRQASISKWLARVERDPIARTHFISTCSVKCEVWTDAVCKSYSSIGTCNESTNM